MNCKVGMLVENTTILVPGFNDDTRILQPLVNYLEQERLQPLALSPQPSNGAASIASLAQQLACLIEQQVPAKQRLNLVGFSMGGLICRVYLQQLGGAARSDRLITVATPHQGTWSAYSYNRPACIEMRPGSQFLAGLNRDLSALQTLAVTSIWTPFDITIIPSINSYLAVGDCLAILSPFHQTMLMDGRIQRVIADTIRRPATVSVPANQPQQPATDGYH